MPQARVSSRRSRAQIEQLVLGVLEQSGRPLSAYDIAQELTASGEWTVPNQVYRTLARLIDQGIVHRFESLSAYVLRQGDFDACLICDGCACVTFLDEPAEVAALETLVRSRGFGTHRIVVEMSGRCATCPPPDTDAPEAIHRHRTADDRDR